MRWREWMLRAEAAIFASAKPVSRETLAGTTDAGPPSFTRLEMLALSAIAYQQPVTRAELSRLAGHDISRDILGRLKSLGVIAPGPRAPMPGAPIAWVTTARFLEIFALGSLADLPDLDTLDAAGGSGRETDDAIEAALDDALGLFETQARLSMTRSLRRSGRRDAASMSR